MKLRRKILLLLITCVGFVHAFGQGRAGDMVVLNLAEHSPTDAKFVGKVKVGDGAFKINCGYETVLRQLMDKGEKLGGNVLKLTQVKGPDGWSTCYRMWADVYSIPDVTAYKLRQKAVSDSLTGTLLPDTASYALLYVYRPKSSVGSVVQYSLHDGDSAICKMKNGNGFIIKMTKPGKTTLWARTEAREEVTLDIKPGKVYFVRCSVKMGVLVGEPKMDLVNTRVGLAEFGKVKVGD